tara:strand:+ start:3967 stop:4170 length:204 start_codon:yes stop_codon:yes gene_type:complete
MDTLNKEGLEINNTIDLKDIITVAKMNAIESLATEYYINIYKNKLESGTCEEELLTILYNESNSLEK